MDCDRFRSDRGAGTPLDDAGRAHLAGCAACRGALEDVTRVDAWLTATPWAAGGLPSDDARERTVKAVLARSEVRRGSARPFQTLRGRAIVALAAASLLVAGFALGRSGWKGLGSSREDRVPAAVAEHERAVYRAISAGLGEALGYVATVDGELLLGLRTASRSGDLRVVFLELRDASGVVLARPRVVLPDGEEAVLRAPGLPDLVVAATRDGAGRVRVAASVRFGDGAEISAKGAAAEPGRTVDLGEVTTRGSRVSVLATAY